jgi:hypothetical protein
MAVTSNVSVFTNDSPAAAVLVYVWTAVARSFPPESRAVNDNVPASPSAEPEAVYGPSPEPDQEVEPDAEVVVAT